MTERTVGIDFGTSTTLVALPDGVLPLGHSTPWMPSLAGYGEDGSLVIGEDAEAVPSGQVIRSVKRTITERRDVVRVRAGSRVRDLPADDLMVAVLTEAIARASGAGADPTTGPVRIGCPAMWDGPQRRRLIDVARRAGLPVTLASLVDEPVAAGIAWLASRAVEVGPVRAVVFDMGGGTLDVAVLDIRGAGRRDISVLAALSDAVAGDALDEAIATDLGRELGATRAQLDARDRADRVADRAMEWLLDAARQTKLALTTGDEHIVVAPKDMFPGREVWYRADRLAEAFAPLMDRAEEQVAAALRVARLTASQPGTAHAIARMSVDALVEGVDVVVLSGGMSHIPYVAQRLNWMFSPQTRIELAGPRPEEAVALGLAGAAAFGRLNLYRPSFDILLEWDEGRQVRTVFDAFTPLVGAAQVARGGADLRFVRDGRDLELPRGAKGQFRVVSHTDVLVQANLGGGTLDGFAVQLDDRSFEFSIYPDGRLGVSDSTGSYDGRIEDWYLR